MDGNGHSADTKWGPVAHDAQNPGFGPLPKLELLDIAGAPGMPMRISDEGVAHLTKDKFPKLRRIYLDCTSVTDDSIDQLRAAFPGLAIVR